MLHWPFGKRAFENNQSDLCSVVPAKEQYAILKELYSFRGPGPDADEVRPCIYSRIPVKTKIIYVIEC